MNRKKIYVTEKDMERLRNVIREGLEVSETQKTYMRRLGSELEKAEIVEPFKIPPYVVTMNSKVKFLDLDTGETFVYTLVYPGFADPDKNRLSVLAPIGTALLGYKVDDIIEWPVPSGVRRLKIEEILYQPEAVGEFDL